MASIVDRSARFPDIRITAGSPPLSPKCSSVLSRLTTKSEFEEKKSSASKVESKRAAIRKAITVIAVVINRTASL